MSSAIRPTAVRFAELSEAERARVVAEAAAAAARAARGGLVTLKTADVLRRYYGGDGWSQRDRAAAAVWLRRLCRALGGVRCGGNYGPRGTGYVMPREALLRPAEELAALVVGVRRPRRRMRLVSVYLPAAAVEALDALVSTGRYPTRSHAIRAAVEEFLRGKP